MTRDLSSQLASPESASAGVSAGAGNARGVTAEPVTARAARRPYHKPELISYGRVEDMTRAGKKSGKEASKKPRSS